MKHPVAACSSLLAAAVALAPAAARAETFCGTAPRAWNVPTGGVVVNKNDGIINTIMDAAGEYYTHSALSVDGGSTDYVIHSTMRAPPMVFYLFHGVVPNTNELQKGDPGPARIYAAAYYIFLYSNSSLQALGWVDGGSNGAATANFMYAGNSGGLSMVSKGDGMYEYKLSGTDMYYRLDQYKNDGTAETGGSNPGLVCSTMISWALNKATGLSITDKTFPGSTVAYATGELRQSIKDECHDSTTWFEDIFANCAGSADKVANCFHSYSKCGEVSEWYKNVQNQDAYTISPDRLIGRGSNDGGGPWQNGTVNSVTFSGTGLWGCWDQ